MVQHHAYKEGKRVVRQQLVRLVDLAQVKSHENTVAGLDAAAVTQRLDRHV